MIDNLKQEFKGSEYHISKRNCNCFSNAFTRKLIGKSIPGYVNRMADLGAYFSCIVDPMIAAAQAQAAKNGQNNRNGAIQSESRSTAMAVATSSSSRQASSTTYSPFTGPARKLGK